MASDEINTADGQTVLVLIKIAATANPSSYFVDNAFVAAQKTPDGVAVRAVGADIGVVACAAAEAAEVVLVFSAWIS